MCGRRSRSKSVDRSLAAPQAKSGHQESYTANGTCQIEVMTRCIGPPPPHVRAPISIKVCGSKPRGATGKIRSPGELHRQWHLPDRGNDQVYWAAPTPCAGAD